MPGADPDEVRELLNYRNAFEFVSAWLGTGGPLGEGLIREIHKRLVKGVRGGSAAPGEFRPIQNSGVHSGTGEVVYTPPTAYDLPVMMPELINWLNQAGQVHPLLASGIAQFQLVHTYPFLGGNGRTSRLLSTPCLYKDGDDFKRLLTFSEYYDQHRTAFYPPLQGAEGRTLTSQGRSSSSRQGLPRILMRSRYEGSMRSAGTCRFVSTPRPTGKQSRSATSSSTGASLPKTMRDCSLGRTGAHSSET